MTDTNQGVIFDSNKHSSDLPLSSYCTVPSAIKQFVIFNPWKVPRNRIAFYQKFFVILPGLLYHLIRRHSGRLADVAFMSNSIVSLKQWLNGLKITN